MMIYLLRYNGDNFNKNVERDLRNAFDGLRGMFHIYRDSHFLHVLLSNTTIADDRCFKRFAEQILETHSQRVPGYSKGYSFYRAEADVGYCYAMMLRFIDESGFF